MEALKRKFLGLSIFTVLLLLGFILTVRWPNLNVSYSSYTIDVEEEKDVIIQVQQGETIQAYPLQIHISTVISHTNFPAKGGFNIFLNGWMRHLEITEFKCCLLHPAPNNTLDMEILTEVKAWLYHKYTQLIVDMQNAEFSCSISRDQLTQLGLANFTHVTFAHETCHGAPNVGVCLKVTYGSLNATRIVEWMEYHRLMAVSSVFTYTSDLDPEVQVVIDFYVKLGFLQAVPAHPPPSKDGPVRGFRRPRYEYQAFVDEVWAANDCKHRMNGMDFVIVMDMDEFIVPQRGLKTYHDILKVAQKKYPKAGGFSFNSHVMLLDWTASRESPLQLGRYTLRSKFPNYDGFDRNSRWASIPQRTYYLRNNMVTPRKPFTIASVPQETYTLLHYRSCKPQWTNCTMRPRLEDKSMLHYERPLAQRILALPGLDKVLFKNTDYVQSLRKWLNGQNENMTQRN